MSWILDRGWFPEWIIGYWLATIIVFPILYGWYTLSQWMWEKHPRTRQWIARHFDI